MVILYSICSVPFRIDMDKFLAIWRYSYSSTRAYESTRVSPPSNLFRYPRFVSSIASNSLQLLHKYIHHFHRFFTEVSIRTHCIWVATTKSTTLGPGHACRRDFDSSLETCSHHVCYCFHWTPHRFGTAGDVVFSTPSFSNRPPIAFASVDIVNAHLPNYRSGLFATPSVSYYFMIWVCRFIVHRNCRCGRGHWTKGRILRIQSISFYVVMPLSRARLSISKYHL